MQALVKLCINNQDSDFFNSLLYTSMATIKAVDSIKSGESYLLNINDIDKDR